jgi:hypothetical protein
LIAAPDPDTDRGDLETPWVHLAPWATAEATALYNKYGDWLVIKVGAMSFPSRAVLGGRGVRQIHGPTAEARGMSLEVPRQVDGAKRT